jgi:inner membrane protein
MPSPIGHSLAGLVTHVGTAPPGELRDPRRALLLVALANAADLDFLLKLVDGQNHHQRWTHSLTCAVIAGFVVAAFTRGRRLGLAAGLAYATHVLLDWLGNDTHPPIGLQALWPFSPEFYKSPWIVFKDVGRQATWETVVNNARAGALEIAILVPVLAVAWWLRRRFAQEVRSSRSSG